MSSVNSIIQHHKENTRTYTPLTETSEKSTEELELDNQLLRQELRSIKHQRRFIGAFLLVSIAALSLLLFFLYSNSTRKFQYVAEIPGKELLLTPVPPRLSFFSRLSSYALS